MALPSKSSNPVDQYKHCQMLQNAGQLVSLNSYVALSDAEQAMKCEDSADLPTGLQQDTAQSLSFDKDYSRPESHDHYSQSICSIKLDQGVENDCFFCGRRDIGIICL